MNTSGAEVLFFSQILRKHTRCFGMFWQAFIQASVHNKFSEDPQAYNFFISFQDRVCTPPCCGIGLSFFWFWERVPDHFFFWRHLASINRERFHQMPYIFIPAPWAFSALEWKHLVENHVEVSFEVILEGVSDPQKVVCMRQEVTFGNGTRNHFQNILPSQQDK